VTRADVARLVALAMIWGASFVFIRVLAPALGPLWVATSRVLVAGGALVAYLVAAGFDAGVRRNWKSYVFVGMLNSALPFLLFAFAAVHLPASYLVILNAATPLFGAVASAIWLGERLTVARQGALIAGAAGVVLVSRAGPVAADAGFALAVAASLGAALCYALAAVWLRKHGAGLKPVAIAGWSQLFAGIVLLPAAMAGPAPATIDAAIVANVLGLALLCSAVAYLLYYRLIADVGPTRALTVTFLMPAFGMAWGAAFLGETITPPMVGGAALIVAGTAMVLRPARRGA
jgi:drug/metabolite transporter (DMT)-like permease